VVKARLKFCSANQAVNCREVFNSKVGELVEIELLNSFIFDKKFLDKLNK
jgi:hypothetical protein